MEQESKLNVLAWIDSGAELCRLEKPATPPKHLISYFVVVNDDHLLLVDHINAELWLPTGGHVDPGEHPRGTALREAKEELSLDGEFLKEGDITDIHTTNALFGISYLPSSLLDWDAGHRGGMIDVDH